MGYTFHDFCRDTAYILILIAYFVIAVLFITVGGLLAVVWWVYEPLAKMLRGSQ
jgi:heme/copper-type cytochrome/quinol oxidase subunit 1